MIEPKKKGKKGCLFLILGTVAAFIGTAVYIFLSGLLSRLVIGSALGGQIAYALLTASLPCVYVVFILLDGVLIVNYLSAEPTEDNGEIQPMLGKRTSQGGVSPQTVKIASIALVAAILPVTLVSVGTYRTVSETGISSAVCFIPTGEYRWEQVSSYEIDCDSQKGLSVTFTMRDGKQYEILQGTVSSPDAFKDKYSCKEAFVVDIMKKMDDLQIPCKTFAKPTAHNKLKENTRAFYKHNEQLWPIVQQIVGYEEVALS